VQFDFQTFLNLGERTVAAASLFARASRRAELLSWASSCAALTPIEPSVKTVKQGRLARKEVGKSWSALFSLLQPNAAILRLRSDPDQPECLT